MNPSIPLNDNDRAYLADLWKRTEEKLSRTAKRIQDGMPYTTIDGAYDDWQDVPHGWTNTFWAGILWHLFQRSGNDEYRKHATSIESKMDQVLYDYEELHHDVGFMWLLSSVNNYRLTGKEKSGKRGLLAASVLSSRYNLPGGFIRAWNGDNAGWAIIDCLMNLPLLFWASEQTRDKRFLHIGVSHARKAAEHFVRPDGSVHHIVVFDEAGGQPVDWPVGQGFQSGSAWSRGQAWAIYGFAQSHAWTGLPEFLATAQRVAHYVLAHLARTGYVPPCDYRQPADSGLLDSSAGAITACGLLEIARHVPACDQAVYRDSALRILKALDESCGNWNAGDEALLTKGTSAFHPNGHRGYVANGALIYGDYYFVEAHCLLKALAS